MEQNTNRMWWTIGLIVLGGLLISGLVMIASTTVMPKISEKANALIKKPEPDVTHTAYAWNEDGTDRFTTTKPNLNLLEGSKKYTKDNPLIASSSAEDGWKIIDDVFVTHLKAGTYIMSAKADAPWTCHYVSQANRQGKVGLWLISTTPGIWISLGETIPKTIEVPEDGDYCVRVNTYSNGKDIETHRFWDFKLEKASDQPKYIGTYTDKSKTDSQDPYKYTWKLNPDYDYPYVSKVQYSAHVADDGWLSYVDHGNAGRSPNENKRLEALRIKLNNADYPGDIQYEAYVAGTGWTGAVTNNNIAGTTGRALAARAIRMRLTGEMANHYDLYYRANVSTVGWLGWAKNNEIAGCPDFDLPMLGYEVKLIRKGDPTPEVKDSYPSYLG